MTDDPEDGYYQAYHVNGQLQTEGWMKNGSYEGQWIYHDIQGKLSSITNYLNSELDGYKEDFDPTGRKTVE